MTSASLVTEPARVTAIGSSRLAGPGLHRRGATRIRIRPIGVGDHDALRAFYAELSPRSRRTRFFASGDGIGDGQSTYFCTPDHAHREGFVAVIGPSGEPGRIVGHVCVEPDGPATAEIAIAVGDAFQGRGVGRRLVDVALAWAVANGIMSLTATMLAGNPAIQRLLIHLGLRTTSRPVGAGVVRMTIDLGVARTAA